jgi:geranylgeranyl diphosphate synthase type II
MWGALLANEERLGQKKTLRILAEFSRIVDATTEGQQMELAWVQNMRWDLGEADYYEMCSRKTSWYTVAGPCRLGAIVAGARPEVLDGLREFGLKLGVGFQIQDDVLNLAGDQSKYGKAKLDDILEGKRTLILLHLLEAVNPRERLKVVSIMNKDRGEKTEDDVLYVRSLIEKNDALSYSQKRARELVEEALAILRTVDLSGESEAISLLESFSRYVVERQW